MSVRLEAVRQLSVETESESSVRVLWRGVSGAVAYRLAWGAVTGQDSNRGIDIEMLQLWLDRFFPLATGLDIETAEVAGDSETYTISPLQPDTEYILTVIPLYQGNVEGLRETARFTIGKFKVLLTSTPNGKGFLCYAKLKYTVERHAAFRRKPKGTDNIDGKLPQCLLACFRKATCYAFIPFRKKFDTCGRYARTPSASGDHCPYGILLNLSEGWVTDCPRSYFQRLELWTMRYGDNVDLYPCLCFGWKSGKQRFQCAFCCFYCCEGKNTVHKWTW